MEDINLNNKMLLKLEQKENQKVGQVLKVISELIDETNIKVTNDGLEIIAFDPSHVSMTILKINKGMFSQYLVETEEIISVKLTELSKVFDRFSKTFIQIEIKDNYLILSSGTKEFKLVLIEIEQEQRDMPILTHTTSLKVKTTDLTEAVNDCQVFADACEFKYIQGQFRVLTKENMNNVDSEIPFEAIKDVNSNAKYPIEYLAKFLKTKFDNVVINYADNVALKLDFKEELINLSFILAPRASEE